MRQLPSQGQVARWIDQAKSLPRVISTDDGPLGRSGPGGLYVCGEVGRDAGTRRRPPRGRWAPARRATPVGRRIGSIARPPVAQELFQVVVGHPSPRVTWGL